MKLYLGIEPLCEPAMVVDVENFYRQAFSNKLQETNCIDLSVSTCHEDDAKKKSSLFCSPKAEPLCRMFLQSKKL